MATYLTDVHTHSTFSPDGRSSLEEMLSTAQEKGLTFYGVSEHIDYDLQLAGTISDAYADKGFTKPEEYFHAARHLQEDYAGVLNVLVGAEFGYSEDARAVKMYQEFIDKYAPDFVVNSIHTLHGIDYWNGTNYFEDGEGKTIPRDKDEVYKEYLALLLRSVRADYHYDIVGHMGYVTRYAPYEDRSMPYERYAQEIDAVLNEIIARDKILEVNSSGKDASHGLPSREILQRYFDLGGRKVSFASDAHDVGRVADKREMVVDLLKEIGFTYITVPCRGEHIKVEI